MCVCVCGVGRRGIRGLVAGRHATTGQISWDGQDDRHDRDDRAAQGKLPIGGKARDYLDGRDDRVDRAKHDKEDLVVWKLIDKVGKLDFRHWVEAVEIHLEFIHGWSKPDAVLTLVRREGSEVTADFLRTIIRRASDKLQEDGLGPADSSDWNVFET